MSLNLVTLLYLFASVFFIQALKGLSHPTTSLRGNLFGMVGMTIAILTTGALIVETSGGKAQGMVYVLGLAARGFDNQGAGGQDGNRHADHAEQVAAQRRGRVRQALERLDEENRS